MIKLILGTVLFIALSTSLAHASDESNELSYNAQVESKSRLKCLYGYYASKSGDHLTAVAIFEDCIERWQDVYSMIWLAHLYENGAGVAQDLAEAFELVKQGSQVQDPAGYSSLAKYHYGVALLEGRGTDKNLNAGVKALREASGEGVTTACDYLIDAGFNC